MNGPSREAAGHTGPERLPTGIPGLDRALRGGLVKDGLYLIEGRAGTGKTMLAMQAAFFHARRGRRVLYMTLIAESHGKLLQHLRSLEFFDDALIADRIRLFSGYRALLEGGLEGLIRFVAEALSGEQPELMILDGFGAARDFSDSRLSLARHVHELNTLVTASRCTTLLLAPPLEGAIPRPEHTLADGLIELSRYTRGLRGVRELEVHKMRGVSHTTGRHVFRISARGLQVYPRLEAVLRDTLTPPEACEGKLAFGAESLDEMLHGGLTAGSTTTLLGAPGSGKTLLGLQFLHTGLRQGEPAIYFGFFESPERLVAKAASAGMDLGPALEQGLLRILWQPHLETHMDELAERLLSCVEEMPAPSRVLVDGVEGFANDTIHAGRAGDFLAALSNKLRMHRLTTLFTEELPLFTRDIDISSFRLSAMVDSILLLRYVEIRSEVRRLISIMKLGDSDYDHAIREFEIGSGGIRVTSKFTSAEAVLTGHARLNPSIDDDFTQTGLQDTRRE